MAEAGVKLRQRKKYKATTNSNHKKPLYDNLVNREFDRNELNEVYAGDLTYLMDSGRLAILGGCVICAREKWLVGA